MKVIDANLLLYAVNEDSPLHERAKTWLEEALSGNETIGFEWTALLAFLRISTRATIFPRPLSPEDALGLMGSWLAQPCSVVVQPTERHLETLRELLRPFGTAGSLTSDAHLAAVAMEHGAEICSCDGDFGRFPGIRWTNPLA